MNAQEEFNRRDFLRLMSYVTAASALGACASRVPPAGVSPPAASKAPTGTTKPLPTQDSGPATESQLPIPIYPEMVIVKPGQFEMGSPDGTSFEAPVHPVRISYPFEIGIFPVTSGEYAAYCADIMKCTIDNTTAGWERFPVSGIDWYGAVDYCNWLSEQAGFRPCFSGKGKFIKCDFTADGYRLPTEAEWEFAARGGNQSQGYIFSGSDDPNDVGWYDGNSGGASHPVGEKNPNELGIFDMSGNRWEWCWDWFDRAYYAVSPEMDPLGPEDPIPSADGYFLEKSRRSGSAVEGVATLRVSYRSKDWINYAGDNGFRLVRSV